MQNKPAAKNTSHQDTSHGVTELFSEDVQRVKLLVRSLLVCNPFYLLSAMALLGGIHMLWHDAQGLSELDRLQMNFLTLQAYEWLLVATVVMLVRRRVWYDATLLVALENLLLAVPFILLSQATWLEGEASRSTLLIAGAGGLLAVGKVAAIRHWFRRLEWPSALLIMGGVLLAVQIALPVIFKQLYLLGETPAVREVWMELGLLLAGGLLLPVLIGLLLFLPRARRHGTEPCDPWWLPWLFGGTWLGVTGYHLWALGYVYDVTMGGVWCLPALWALLWVGYARRVWFLGHLNASGQAVLVALPMVIFLGVLESPMSPILMGCSLANAGIYSWLALQRRYRRQQHYLLGLAAVALAGAVAYLPMQVGQQIADSWSRPYAVAAAAVVLLLLLVPLTRSIWLGLLAGSGATGLSMLALDRLGGPLELGWQVGAVFVLLHSLRWQATRPRLADAVRLVIAAGWLLASLKWLHFAGDWQPVVGSLVPALLLLASYAFHRLWLGQREPRLVLYAALGMLILQPLYPVLDIVVEAGPAVMMLAAAFILFGMGTLLAWNRQEWLQPAGEEVAGAA